MDIEKIRQLIELIDQTNIAEIEIREGETSVRLTRQGAITTAVAIGAPVQQSLPTSVIVEPQAAATPPAAPSAETKGHTVTSPMVGTVYLAANPNAKPFVEIGQTIKQGDILCIVEAMKMMNQIEADKSGTIAARFVENASPVEFGQPLFVIQ